MASAPVQKVLGAIPSAKPIRDGWQARCPAHEDARASLSVGTGEDGRALLHCHAGCTTEAVTAALGLTMADLMVPSLSTVDSDPGPRQPTAIYPYRDEQGTLLYEVARHAPKRFVQRRPDGPRGYVYRLSDVRRVIFRLDVLHAARPEAVFVVEGEKDVQAIERLALHATTNSGGASKWTADHARQLAGCGVRRVCVLPDNDEPGRAHAEQVAATCHAIGIEARIVPLPGLAEKGDPSDWIAAGGTKDALKALAKAAPVWTPAHPTMPSGERLVRLTQASTITVRPVQWLWEGRLALGSFGLLGGREGIGKTTCAYTLGAAVTRGTLPGACHGTPRAIGIAATEDSWAHTIVPKLMAAGADLERVYRVDVQSAAGTDSTLTLPRDLDGLAEQIRRVEMAALILDPILSRLDVSLDSHKDAEVRVALEPLTKMAEETGICIVGLIHVSKSTSGDPLTMLMASRAFAAVARFVLFVMADPDTEGLRLLGQPKNNLGRTDLPTLAFRITGARVADTSDGPVWTGKLEWQGESERTLDDALHAAQSSQGDRSAVAEAADWLLDYLTAAGGVVESKAVKVEGKKAGYSEDTLKRAAKRLRVKVESKGFPRRTFWMAPLQSVQSPGETSTTTPTALTGECPKDSDDHSRSTVGAVGAVEEAPGTVALTDEHPFTTEATYGAIE